MKRITLALVVVLVFALSGCATLFKGSTEKVSFASDPDGAQVFVNGMMMGNTPLQLNLKSKDTYAIDFRKAGYENKVTIVNNKVGAGWIILDVITGFIPIIIDAATGDWMQLDTNNVNASLIKQ